MEGEDDPNQQKTPSPEYLNDPLGDGTEERVEAVSMVNRSFDAEEDPPMAEAMAFSIMPEEVLQSDSYMEDTSSGMQDEQDPLADPLLLEGPQMISEPPASISQGPVMIQSPPSFLMQGPPPHMSPTSQAPPPPFQGSPLHMGLTSGPPPNLHGPPPHMNPTSGPLPSLFGHPMHGPPTSQGPPLNPPGLQGPPVGPPPGIPAPPMGPPPGLQGQTHPIGPPPGFQGPPMSQAPPGAQGPPHISQASPHMSQGPPHMSQGPPHMSQGPPHMSQGPPHMSQGPPPMSHGPPHMSQGPPPMSQESPNMSQGPPHMSQGPPPLLGPPPGPPPMRGPPPGLGPPEGPPPISAAPPQVIQSQAVISEAAKPAKLPSLLSLKVEPPKELEKATEVVLPQALEQVLAMKNLREKEIENTVVTKNVAPEREPLKEKELEAIVENEIQRIEEATAPLKEAKEKDVKEKISKNKKKKERRKNKKKTKENETRIRLGLEDGEIKEIQDKPTKNGETENEKEKETKTVVDIEYIQESIGLHELAPQYRQFYSILQQFKITEEKANIPPPILAIPTLSTKPMEDDRDDDNEDMDDKKPDDKSKMSKRKLKKLTRLSVAELKQLVHRPDVVEMHDVTARDPKLLVQLKAHRNTVQVPRHWCFKRKYLQGKRGIEKPPFNLPDFIKRTGIMEMRASLQEKDESKTLKAKMRERARPKLGKIDIDYQKLHDAFFKWQTKPKMTIHGDLYYEGKEFETRLKEKKPGDLSEELRTALGMPVGPNANKVPPPWLIAMQRYGPPPSYPNLKIPGLNAPIPDGCSFGYHAGGWGKPPVDETGKPLYGDVFGSSILNLDDMGEDATVDKALWGELESESEEESEEEEEEEEEAQADESGLVTPAEGLATPSGGVSSLPPGMETPEAIELRKKKIENEMEGTETPVLYHVIPEKRQDRIGNAMMGSTHVYDMTAAGVPQPPATIRKDREGMVELALDPSELDLDSDAMAVRYEQQMRENQSQLQKEDLSDMLAEHVAKQKSKRKRQQQQEQTKSTKKYKEFKF